MREVHAVGAVGSLPEAANSELQSVRAGSRLLSDGSIRHKAFRLSTTEAPSVTLLRELLSPLVCLTTLGVCLWAGGVRFSSQWLALGLIVFLLTARGLSIPGARIGAAGLLKLRPTLARLLLEWCCVSGLLAFLATALRMTDLLTRATLIRWFLVTPAALLLSNFAAIRLASWMSARRHGTPRYIIIGATEVGLELAKRVEQRRGIGDFMGFFDYRDPGRLPQMAPERWAGTCKSVTDFVRREAVDAIYIALPISTAPRIAELLRELRDTTASIYFVPNLFAFDLVQPRCIEIHGIPALAVCETPFHGMCGLRKRATDIALGLLGLLLAAPLMLGIAIAVKLSSRGPVLFKQRRYGLNGEEIYIYKFRSMTVCEDGPVVMQATRNDQRITPLGRFLRRTSLDELPQILNVLEGKMSMVGPRPHAIAHNELYRKLISGYMIRHKVRPGITGWAQVNGLRGETDTVEKMRARVEYDIDYLKNWSLWLDLKILLRTMIVVLRDRQAY
jgi:putative colanic acid biosynthesis UDP-glucose lipid carrier transferase